MLVLSLHSLYTICASIVKSNVQQKLYFVLTLILFEHKHTVSKADQNQIIWTLTLELAQLVNKCRAIYLQENCKVGINC